MADVTVTIPTMLATLVRGDRRFTVSGDDLGAVVEAVLDRHPELRVHLLDEQESIRPHVAMFHNGSAVRSFERPVGDGDTFLVLQAVSGG